MAPLNTGWRRGTHVREARDGFDPRRYFIARARRCATPLAALEITRLVFDDQGRRVHRWRSGHRGSFCGSVLDWRRLPLESVLKHLLDPAHRMYFEAVLDFVADLDQVLDVLLGDQHLPDATASRREQFLLETADWEHFAAQRDFACHRDVRAHRNAGQYRHDRRADGRAGARPVLGRGTLGQVNVQVGLLVEVRRDTELFGTMAYHRQRSRDRLIHDVAELACSGGLALARQRHRFDGQQIAADFGPGESGNLSDLVLFLGNAVGVAAHTEIFVEILGADLDRAFGGPGLALARLEQQRLDYLAADLGHVALERPDPSFARVVARDVAQRRVGDVQLVCLEPVVFRLLRNQILLRDGDFLILGVTGETNHFHPVEQRRRDIECVRSGDEHHVREIEFDLDVMIDEGVVLFGVEHFQQRRGRIAAEIHAHLVDF